MQGIQLDLGTRRPERSTPRGRRQSKTRNRKRLWYSAQDVPPGRIRRVIDFTEVAASPVDDEHRGTERAVVLAAG